MADSMLDLFRLPPGASMADIRRRRQMLRDDAVPIPPPPEDEAACGGSNHPESFMRLRERWSSLTEREKRVADELLTTRYLHGLPEAAGRGWMNGYFDALRALFDELVFDVEEVGADPRDVLGIRDD